VVLVPKDNKRDLDEVPKNVLRRLDVQLVENMSEVLAVALVPAVQADA